MIGKLRQGERKGEGRTTNKKEVRYPGNEKERGKKRRENWVSSKERSGKGGEN